MAFMDNDHSERANELARIPNADADTMTAMVAQQLAGFAANPMVALDHNPDHLARVAISRAIAALRALTAAP